MSKNEEHHKKWQGFSENKVKRLVKQLEMLDSLKLGQCLEFRPYPISFKLQNEEFPYADAYYIGMRVRGGVLPKKEIIDLNDTRRIFFDKFWASLEANKPVQDLSNEK